MLLTSSNIYIKDAGKFPDHDHDTAVIVSSWSLTLHESGLLASHKPNEMYRTFYIGDISGHQVIAKKRIVIQFFTLAMIIYKDEWRP